MARSPEQSHSNFTNTSIKMIRQQNSDNNDGGKGSQDESSQGSDFDYLNMLQLGSGANSQMKSHVVDGSKISPFKNSSALKKTVTQGSADSHLTATDVIKVMNTTNERQEDSYLAGFEMASLKENEQ